jgi:hypothetical protein
MSNTRNRSEIEADIARTEDTIDNCKSQERLYSERRVDAQEALKNLKNELEQCGKKWKPKIGEAYFYSVIGIHEFYGTSIWGNDECDNMRFTLGRVYRTAEEAIEDGKRMYYSELYRSMSDVTEEDWKEGSKPKHYTEFDYRSGTVRIDFWSSNRSQGTAFFTSEQKCREAISAIGEDNFIKYVLGVKR